MAAFLFPHHSLFSLGVAGVDTERSEDLFQEEDDSTGVYPAKTTCMVTAHPQGHLCESPQRRPLHGAHSDGTFGHLTAELSFGHCNWRVPTYTLMMILSVLQAYLFPQLPHKNEIFPVPPFTLFNVLFSTCIWLYLREYFPKQKPGCSVAVLMGTLGLLLLSTGCQVSSFHHKHSKNCGCF